MRRRPDCHVSRTPRGSGGSSRIRNQTSASTRGKERKRSIAPARNSACSRLADGVLVGARHRARLPAELRQPEREVLAGPDPLDVGDQAVEVADRDRRVRRCPARRAVVAAPATAPSGTGGSRGRRSAAPSAGDLLQEADRVDAAGRLRAVQAAGDDDRVEAVPRRRPRGSPRTRRRAACVKIAGDSGWPVARPSGAAGRRRSSARSRSPSGRCAAAGRGRPRRRGRRPRRSAAPPRDEVAVGLRVGRVGVRGARRSPARRPRRASARPSRRRAPRTPRPPPRASPRRSRASGTPGPGGRAGRPAGSARPGSSTGRSAAPAAAAGRVAEERPRHVALVRRVHEPHVQVGRGRARDGQRARDGEGTSRRRTAGVCHAPGPCPAARWHTPAVRAVVVGAGILGLSAARVLAERGHVVTALDRYGSGPSGDELRRRDPDLPPGLCRARLRAPRTAEPRGWRDLDARTGETVLLARGQVEVGGPVPEIAATLARAGRPARAARPRRRALPRAGPGRPRAVAPGRRRAARSRCPARAARAARAGRRRAGDGRARAGGRAGGRRRDGAHGAAHAGGRRRRRGRRALGRRAARAARAGAAARAGRGAGDVLRRRRASSIARRSATGRTARSACTATPSRASATSSASTPRPPRPGIPTPRAGRRRRRRGGAPARLDARARARHRARDRSAPSATPGR